MATILLTTWIKYAVDALALVVLLTFAFTSLKKGFIRCLFGFVSTFVAIIFALLLMKSVLSWTNGLFGLQDAMASGLESAFSKTDAFNIDVSAVGLETALEGKVPTFLQGIIVDSFGNASLPAGTTLASIVGGAVANLGATLIAFLLLFIIIKTLLKLLSKALSSVVEKLPIVGTLNGLLGFLVGAIQGLLIVSAVVAVLSLFPSQNITAFFNECIFIKWLYNSNPIYTVFGWFI